MLQPRLKAVLDLVAPVGAVADVGAGDGALALALAERGQPVVATELRGVACQALRGRLPGSVTVRQGYGLDPIQPGEVRQVVLAGMGPHTIATVLAKARGRLGEFERLVLLPHREAWPLRGKLGSLSLAIVDERLAVQRGFVYQALAVRQVPTVRVLEPLEVWLGPVNLLKRPRELALLVEQCRRRLLPRRPSPERDRLLAAMEGLAHAL
jgi:tRNA (adenine22-N1)-methyltransferase